MAQRRVDFLTEIPLLAIDESALQLATQLLQRGMIPARAAEDASHIAIAAVHGMDYLLTWNCQRTDAKNRRRDMPCSTDTTTDHLHA
jgi:hypothetical protein